MYVYSVYTAMLCMQKMFNLYTRNVKTLEFWLNFLLGIYSAVHVPPVYVVLCSI